MPRPPKGQTTRKRAPKSTAEPPDLEKVRLGLTAYVETGRFRRASKRTGIPWQTIQGWVRSGKYDDMLGQIKHAHAKEVRAAFAGQAGAFARDLAQGRAKVAQLLRATTDGKEAASLLRALGATAETMARVGQLIEEPGVGDAAPAIFRVSVERPASEE